MSSFTPSHRGLAASAATLGFLLLGISPCFAEDKFITYTRSGKDALSHNNLPIAARFICAALTEGRQSDIEDKSLKCDYLETLSTASAVAAALEKSGDLATAELVRATHVGCLFSQEVAVIDTPSNGDAVYLARTYVKRGKLDLAKRTYELVVGGADSAKKRQDLFYLGALTEYPELLRKMSRTSEAESFQRTHPTNPLSRFVETQVSVVSTIKQASDMISSPVNTAADEQRDIARYTATIRSSDATGRSDLKLARALKHLGDIYYLKNRKTEALALHTRALPIFERLSPRDELVRCLDAYASDLSALDRWTEMGAAYTRCKQLKLALHIK